MHCIVLYCIVLYCIVLYCIVLCCIVLYCIVYTPTYIPVQFLFRSTGHSTHDWIVDNDVSYFLSVSS